MRGVGCSCKLPFSLQLLCWHTGAGVDRASHRCSEGECSWEQGVAIQGDSEGQAAKGSILPIKRGIENGFPRCLKIRALEGNNRFEQGREWCGAWRQR